MPDSKGISKCISSYASRFTRRKFIDTNVMETHLRRCLSTVDITLLSVGHMVGSGVYILAATTSKNMAGPAIIVSFLFSGFASFLAALCYAELGVRYPKCGSAYSYTYLALGEMWAFFVGWNITLEHVIAVAAVSRACSNYIDSLVGGIIKNGTDNLIGEIDVPYLATHMDLLAFGILWTFTFFLSFGVRMTSHLNNVFSVTNMIVILIIVCVGAYFADIKNWTNPDTGGFMPYGWSGVLAASASCFYAFVGFDSIASSGEEVRDPQKSIPRATMISMGIATLAYVSVSAVLTLMVNYRDIDDDAGLPDALAVHGAHWAKIVVIVGAVCGMATGIIGSLFALTRVVYIMADDGLLFEFCATVNMKTKIPLKSMYIFVSLAAVITLLFDINTLVEVLSIGTLFAYLVVSASVIVLRYRPTVQGEMKGRELPPIGEGSTERRPVDDIAGQFQERFKVMRTYFHWLPEQGVPICVLIYVIFAFLLCGFVRGCSSSIAEICWWAILILVILLLCTSSPLALIALHQQTTGSLLYKIPLVPLIPALSILVNATLIVNLKAATWLRLFVWVAVGLSIYLSYGVSHSKLDTMSPRNTFLKPEMNHLPSRDNDNPPSLSREILVDNADLS